FPIGALVSYLSLCLFVSLYWVNHKSQNLILIKICCFVLFQYQWNEDEKFLFRATIAFAMRAYTKDESYNVLICNETQRVSFWIQFTSNASFPFFSYRSSRNRINSAFLLSDKTLDVACCIGVVIGIVTLGIIAIIVSGVLCVLHNGTLLWLSLLICCHLIPLLFFFNL
uniref:Collectrin, amino acid transport regulator n=1 Tax=Erpetoichthys calabaricus TaxID=27687 RepID=A0A8C4RJK3_ERPCA